ncbi:uncharacterized protein LOC103104764 [Monodelphis domestica]|uniref:uncharacterized protein LOC103104764 n=1 Tax=Monodelphis domestica TaxID=13616 RepID=UPI0024E23F10|nr:uncharacterized protein LOC103104764 [Monodelphis domestica]XP_056649496.1 uncharacterized protein LOC103104764 [Monodelphis domestica]XP_056649497.1 uncharacterized protein LOC103104764 [Monodelphis domestica]
MDGHWDAPPTNPSVKMSNLCSSTAPLCAKVSPWLFLPIDKQMMLGDVRQEVKEKLREHSAKVVPENRRPLCPLMLYDGPEKPQNSNCEDKDSSHSRPVAFPRPSLFHSLPSPKDIKQEARRRLQLHRQNSSPNLALYHLRQGLDMIKHRTTDSRETRRLELERKVHLKGQLYIPTFEEFKKMKQKLPDPSPEPPKQRALEELQSLQESTKNKNPHIFKEPSLFSIAMGHPVSEMNKCSRGLCCLNSNQDLPSPNHLISHNNICLPRTTNENPFISQNINSWDPSPETSNSAVPNRDDPSDPICCSPISRSILQTDSNKEKSQIKENKAGILDFQCIVTHSSRLSPTSAVPSCCPTLLLEVTDVSCCGTKLKKMKDGIIDSALDLIKKSCTPIVAVKSPSWSQEPQDVGSTTLDNNSRFVEAPIATQICWKEMKDKIAKDTHLVEWTLSSNCHCSSLNNPLESSKSPQECQPQPHFSGSTPMTNNWKKQLELKSAATIHQHMKKWQTKKNPELPGVPHGWKLDENNCSLPAKQHWNNMDHLSTGNQVTGLCEGQDENEPCGDQEPGPALRAGAAEAEQEDPGLESALAPSWRSQASTVSNSPEAHCTDCREEKEALSPGHRSLCGQCTKLRWERKQAVLEFIQTEASYGENLRVIKEQFQLPMQSAGLLSPGQLLAVFSNIQELIDLNEKFLESLKEEIAEALSQGDDDLMNVCVGGIFLKYVNMLPAFQTYCLQQASSISTLSTLEKEKELLRIFLHASQTNNTALRRMNLRSFLMAPLQRITKYPLLLSRITQATATFHPDYSHLCEATSHLASYLEHINRKTRQEGSLPWALRPFRQDVCHHHEAIAAIDRRELALKTLGWLWEETHFVMEGGLQLAQLPDGPWTRKGSRTLKFQTLQVILMARLQKSAEIGSRHGSLGQGPVGDAALVLIRDKSHGKLNLVRSPVRLGQCVVSADPVCKTFELLEIQQGALILRDEDYARTQLWLYHIRVYARQLGSWKRRRNALPNIMINIPNHP